MSSSSQQLSSYQLAPKPIWDGPEDSSKSGGVTQSLLGRYLACPARFKALVIDNLKPRDKFEHRIQYGNLFHLCDELHSKNLNWEIGLKKYVENLLIHYPFNQVEILKWWRVCQVQFSVYLDYWRDFHNNSVSLLQEEVFHVPYKLPSGRVVYLRGKWDAIILDNGLWVYDTKTKSEIDKEKIERRLKYDLQMMFYAIALREYCKIESKKYSIPCPLEEPIRGIKYNVIRRPLSGGEGDIKQTQKETEDQFFDRLKGVIDGTGVKRTGDNYTGPSVWFARWESEVGASDIEEFEKNTLIPCLERLCTWYEVILEGNTEKMMPASFQHFTMPFGYPIISDEYGTEYDDYVISGNRTGLMECTNLFPELNEE